jgi:hypothetical protein
MIIARYPCCLGPILLVALAILFPSPSSAWYDETHLVIAKIAGYAKWFNAAGPDVAKLKLRDVPLRDDEAEGAENC